MEDKPRKKLNIWISNIKKISKRIKKDIGALYLAYKRNDVPLYVKIISILVVGYALSPIDLIPDFIPVLGYVDDLILVPIGIYLAIKLIPKSIMDECRQQAEDIFSKNKPKSWIAGVVIICIWIIAVIYFFMRLT